MCQQAYTHSIHRHWWCSKMKYICYSTRHTDRSEREKILSIELTIKRRMPYDSWNTSLFDNRNSMRHALHQSIDCGVIFFNFVSFFRTDIFYWQTLSLDSKCANCHKSTNFNHVHLTIDYVPFGFGLYIFSLFPFESIQRRVNIIDGCPTHVRCIVILNFKMLPT